MVTPTVHQAAGSGCAQHSSVVPAIERGRNDLIRRSSQAGARPCLVVSAGVLVWFDGVLFGGQAHECVSGNERVQDVDSFCAACRKSRCPRQMCSLAECPDAKGLP